MKLSTLLSGLAAGLLLASLAPAQAPLTRPAQPATFPRQRVVGLEVGVDAQALAASVGATLRASFGTGAAPIGPGGPGRVALLEWPTIPEAQSGASQLGQLPGTRFVERNLPVRSPASVVCPPPGGASAQQCTAAFFDGAPSLPKYADQRAVLALDVASLPAPRPNANTVVAVIDTGIDPLHPLFLGRLAGPGRDFLTGLAGGYDVPNGLDDDGDGLIDEAYGHGTHVAGLIVLIDPSARILPLRVLDSDGNGSAFAVAQAIHFAGELEVDVINLSLSLSGPSAAVETALGGLDDDDTWVFASAGNGGSLGVSYPARYPGVVAVAAVDALGVKPDFASYGPEVDLVAPGVDVYSAMPGDAWAWWSGSSMATALAAGAAARLISSYDVEAEDSGEALLDSAFPVDALNPTWSGWLGRGLVQLGAAGVLLASGD